MNFSDYIKNIHDIGNKIDVLMNKSVKIDIDKTINLIIEKLYKIKKSSSKKVIFIGNGGSAGISSHCSIDFLRTAGIRSLNFNDGASLTCLSNDYGYPYVFSKQIEAHGQEGDLLFAISSSGNSQNILNAVEIAEKKKLFIVTLSGFKKGNLLNKKGDLSIFVENNSYGYVEIIHLIILHSILDFFVEVKEKSL